jgi:two-component system CheB/CheR fusion protein
MNKDLNELDRLRRSLQDAEQQQERDRVVIANLRKEVSEFQRETQHQVRNILSVVRSIARRTVEDGETAEEYQVRLDSRLASFANLQSQIVRDPKAGVDLCTLLDNELLAFGVKLGQEAHVDGPPVSLEPKPAGILGLAFHELARMAIEGGTSAGLDGQIQVRWRLKPAAGDPEYLEIIWLETGRLGYDGSKPEPAFGREVVEQAFAYEAGGEVTLDITEDGLKCRFHILTDYLAGVGKQIPTRT